MPVKNLFLCALFACSLPFPLMAAEQCHVQESTLFALNPVADKALWEKYVPTIPAQNVCTSDSSIDKIMQGTDVLALVKGVSFDGTRNLSREGPLVALNRDGTERCTGSADVENLRPPFVLAKGRYFYFVSADGVDFRIEAVDLTDCSISWKSPTYDWADVTKVTYENGRYLVGKRKGKDISYTIQPNCQAAKGNSR